jgi:hypothetical protein
MNESSAEDVIIKVSIKFLLSNGVTGSLIGSGGSFASLDLDLNYTSAKLMVSEDLCCNYPHNILLLQLVRYNRNLVGCLQTSQLCS